jgi:hypothetical protein
MIAPSGRPCGRRSFLGKSHGVVGLIEGGFADRHGLIRIANSPRTHMKEP